MEYELTNIIRNKEILNSKEFRQFFDKYVGDYADEDFNDFISFLENDKPWLYDFKNEKIDGNYSESIQEENQKGINIVHYFDAKRDKKSRHCDSCNLAKIIYKFLWKWPLEKKEGVNGLIELGKREEKKKVFCSPDTINSFFHIFNFIMINEKKFDTDFFKELDQKRGKNYYQWLSTHMHEIRDILVGNKSDKEKSTEEKNNAKLFTEFNKFALLTHTIGNFILVPPAWNVCRNSMFGDYFDVFLENWKSGKLMLDISILKKYCEKFYLNIEIGSNGFPLYFNGKINSFLGKEKEVRRPNNIEEILDYIENVNCFIEARGKKLVKKIFENIQIEYDKYKNNDFTQECEELSNTITIPVIIDEINAEIVSAIFFKIDLKNNFHSIDNDIWIKYIENSGCILHNGEIIVCKSLASTNFEEKNNFNELFDFFEKDDFALINVGSIILPRFIFPTDIIKCGELYRIPYSIFKKSSCEKNNIIFDDFDVYNEKILKSEIEEKSFRIWSEEVFETKENKWNN